MQIDTRHFGTLDVDQKDLINFEDGIPGFQYIRKFFLINTKEPDSPFKWLQSFDYPEFAFVIVDPFSIIKDYYIDIPESVVENLEIKEPADVEVFAIVVVPDDINKMTANFKCPVIINSRVRKGSQVLIENSPYLIRQQLIIRSA